MSANTAIHRVPSPARVRARNTALMPRARVMFWTRIAWVVRDSRTNCGNLRRSSSISATPAVSMAVSVPAAPMAKPMSARARAGASLIPSPTMPTREPSAWRASTSRSLSSGRRLPRAASMPTWAAMAAAVCGLSPVSIRVFTSSACSSRIASRLLSLTPSATAKRARTRCGSHSAMTVLPWRSRASRRSSRAGEQRPSSSTRRWLPRW